MKTYVLSEAQMQAVMKKLESAQEYQPISTKEPRPVSAMDIACSRVEDALSLLRSILPSDDMSSKPENSDISGQHVDGVNMLLKAVEHIIEPYNKADDTALYQGMVCGLTLKQQHAIIRAREALATHAKQKGGG